MEKRNLFIFLFLFISLVVNVFSVQPSTQINNIIETPSLSIIYPKNDHFTSGEDITLHFHVYNSTYSLVDDVSGSCYIHIYNNMGNHIIEDNLSWDSNDIDFYININSSTIQQLGQYDYLVYCNSSNGEGGFISTSFNVQFDNVDNNSKIYFIIGVLGVSIILLYIAFNLDDTHKILRFGIILITLFIQRLVTTSSSVLNGNAGISFIKIYDRILWVIIGWFIIYFLFEVMLRPFAEKKGWIKKKENDN